MEISLKLKNEHSKLYTSVATESLKNPYLMEPPLEESSQSPFLKRKLRGLPLVAAIVMVYFLSFHFRKNISVTPEIGTYDRMKTLPIPNLINTTQLNVPEIDHFVNAHGCPLCKFKQANTLNNSTPRDFIFCFAFGKTKNILPFIRTLRTTGSKASVAVFLDDLAYNRITKETMETATSCGMQIFNLGDLGELTKPRIMSLPYFLSYHIVNKNYNKIDRLIIMDLFDSVFQADPFTTYLNNSLHFSPEFRKLKYTRINRKWIKLAGLLDQFPDSWLESETICAGYLGGPIKLIKPFLYEFYTCKGIVEGWLDNNIDQGTFNFLYLSGRLKEIGIPARLHFKDDIVQHFSVGLPEYPGDTFPFVVNPRSKFKPVPIVHHYYRSQHFIDTVIEQCPIENTNWQDYAANFKK